MSELEIDSWLLAPDSLASLLRLDEELSDESIEAREVDQNPSYLIAKTVFYPMLLLFLGAGPQFLSHNTQGRLDEVLNLSHLEDRPGAQILLAGQGF